MSDRQQQELQRLVAKWREEAQIYGSAAKDRAAEHDLAGAHVNCRRRDDADRHARELDAALAAGTVPHQVYPIRAHVEGCAHALSVPVDLCDCGGRDFTPEQAKMLVTIAEEFERAEAETRDTLQRINKRIGTGCEFDGDASTAKHYRWLVDHYGERARAVRSAIAQAAVPAVSSAQPPAEETTVLQAVLDAIKGTLDPHTQIADHPNVKFAQMERLKWADELQQLREWQESALQALAKSDVLHEVLKNHGEYLGWDVHDAAADLIRKLSAVTP